MRFAVFDEADRLFAELVVAIAERHDHEAIVFDSFEALGTLATSPSVIVVGFEELSAAAVEVVRSTRLAFPGAALFVVAEDPSPRFVLAALEGGASDVLHRPILPQEVLLRARRANAALVPRRVDTRITIADLEIDPDRAVAMKSGRDLNLTRVEARLLYGLARQQGEVTSVDDLVAFAWGDVDAMPTTLKTHISRIRKKLREAGGAPIEIRPRRSLGYILEAPGTGM